MSWFPVDDAFHSHPKMRHAGLEAAGLWVVSGSFCMAYLTDGFVPEWFVKEKPRGMSLAKRLVASGLWDATVKDGGEKGWQFHDWKTECTKEHVENARRIARDRKRKSRAAATSPDDVSQGESRVTSAVSPPSCLVPTQPNPTQPNPSFPLVDLGGAVTQVGAPGRPKCSKHQENAETGCRTCMRRREWDEAHEQSTRADEVTQRRIAKERSENCPVCHGSNWIPDTDPAVKCGHDAQLAKGTKA